MTVLNRRPTRRRLLKAIKGLEIEALTVEAEIVEMPSLDGIFKNHQDTGRRFVRITARRR